MYKRRLEFSKYFRSQSESSKAIIFERMMCMSRGAGKIIFITRGKYPIYSSLSKKKKTLALLYLLSKRIISEVAIHQFKHFKILRA